MGESPWGFESLRPHQRVRLRLTVDLSRDLPGLDTHPPTSRPILGRHHASLVLVGESRGGSSPFTRTKTMEAARSLFALRFASSLRRIAPLLRIGIPCER